MLGVALAPPCSWVLSNVVWTGGSCAPAAARAGRPCGRGGAGRAEPPAESFPPHSSWRSWKGRPERLALPRPHTPCPAPDNAPRITLASLLLRTLPYKMPSLRVASSFPCFRPLPTRQAQVKAYADAHSGPVTDLTFDAGAEYLASCSGDGSVTVGPRRFFFFT